MKNIEEKVYQLVLPYTKENNIEIYDIIYEKRGKSMYLSIYIDKEEGINIQDCENLNNYINPLLDDNIDIKEKYYLEVSSAGLERIIRKEEHLKKYLNTKIHLSLYKSINKIKEYEGILKKYDENVIELEIENEKYSFERNNISLIKTVYDWE